VGAAEDEREQQRWLLEWVREESFWRDITTRSLAILISGAVLYILALAGGYVRTPDGSITSLVLVPLVLMMSLGAYGLLKRRSDTPRKRRHRDTALLAFWLLLAATIFIIAVGGD
jgi:multisubunit Na+/H+ antiporter MnhB subunit